MVVLISLCIVTFVPTFVFVAVKHHGFKSQKECSGFRILEEVTTRGVSTISCLQASTKITSSFLVRAFDLARFNCSKIFAASRADVPNLATMIAFGIYVFTHSSQVRPSRGVLWFRWFTIHSRMSHSLPQLATNKFKIGILEVSKQADKLCIERGAFHSSQCLE